MKTAWPVFWVVSFIAVLVWSGIQPHDRYTWILEVSPAVIGLLILAATRHRFPLTPLVYALIWIHAVILMIGGHYTYALVPAFDQQSWLGQLLDWQRNNYDKLGHFVQGFVPALIARELFIRLDVIPKPAWRNFCIVCFCLAFSAFYELIEWWVALLSDTAAEAFLGTQGYVWDTQSDMGFCLLGAILGLLLLGHWHDRQLNRWQPTK